MSATRLRKKIIKIFLLNICFLSTFTNAWGTVRALVESKNSSRGELIILSIEEEKVNQKEPDFSALERDFEVLSQTQSVHTAVINGNISESTVWEFNLLPKKMGELSIPALEIDGEFTKPILINISANKKEDLEAAKDVFMETKISPDKITVNSPLKVKVKVYCSSRIKISDAELIKPVIPDATWVDLDDVNDTAYLNGKLYRTYEKNYLLFLSEAKKYNLGGFILIGNRIEIEHASQYDAFGFSNYVNKPFKLIAKDFYLTVSANNIGNSQKVFCNAEKLKLSQKWSDEKTAHKSGSAVTRTIEIQADNSLLTPNMQLADNLSTDFYQQYADKPKVMTQVIDGKLVTTFSQALTYIFTQAGKVELPEIKINWLNHQTQKIETAKLSGLNLSIAENPALNSLNNLDQPKLVNEIANPKYKNEGAKIYNLLANFNWVKIFEGILFISSLVIVGLSLNFIWKKIKLSRQKTVKIPDIF